MKKFLILLLSAALCLGLVACGNDSQGNDAQTTQDGTETTATQEQLTEPIQAMTLKGPTGVAMAKMMESDNYDFRVAASPDEVVAALSSGEADIASIPTNLAAKLYAKTEGNIVMLSIDTLGTLYLLENGDSVQSIEDLAGKSIYLAGQGSNPQYIIEYLLDQAGVEAELVYKSEHAEVATLLAAGEIDLALLPEPNVTATLMKSDTLRIALDCGQLWQEASGSELAMGCLAARRDFVESNPQAVELVLADLAASVDFALNNVADTAALCVQYEIIPAQQVAEQAIPNCSLVCITGADMKTTLASYFDVLLAADPSSIGGALPADDFYYGL